MGEIFERRTPTVPLAWTGERLTTEAGSQVEVEHLHRYLLARDLCRGFDVLDVASGEGYGSALLAQTARSVVGIELDLKAVKHAQSSYVAPNLRFVEGDARHLPLPDACVDVVVSFETIEHLYEQDIFLAEVRRVLRPGGRFLVSSPERDVYSPAGLPPNPYHVRELTRGEFSCLLHSNFEHVTLLGQRPILGSALVAERPVLQPASALTRTFERRGPNRFEASDGLPRPVYLLAIASSTPIGVVPDSLYIDSSTIETAGNDLSRDNSNVERVTEALAEAGEYARHLEAQLTEHDRNLTELKHAFSTAEALGSATAARLDEAQNYARHLEAELMAAQKRADRLKMGLVARDGALVEATRTTARTRAEHSIAVAKIVELSTYVRHLETSLEGVGALVQQLDHQDRSLTAELANRTTELESSRTELLQKEAELEERSAELNIVLSSSSWRVSKPLRSLVGRYPRARKVTRRLAKLAWGTAGVPPSRRIAVGQEVQSTPVQPLLVPSVVPPRVGDIPMCFGIAEHSSGSEDPKPEPQTVNASANTQVVSELDQKAAFTDLARAELLDFIASGERILLPASDSPDVSVVVVLWNQAHLTLRCLRALLTQLGPEMEVVLVDNASTDETGELLARLDGVRVLPNTTNDGFLLACNRGAMASRGRTLLLLNSDAFMRPGALATALATLDAAPDIGVVGGRLILPSGRLQEAGSIIWADGSTLGYGRDLAQDAGEAMFRRDVDYCSGAFLLTPLALWRHLGGFDEVYKPAYYEEADYCMRVREAGCRVVYEPGAVVDHYEFGSEIKRGDTVDLVLRNRKYFRVRQATRLHQHHLPFAEANILAARQRLAPGRRRLLVIDNEVPLSFLGAGYPRAREMLCEAATAGWSVTFFPLHQLDVDWEVARGELPWEIEIVSNHAGPRLAEFFEERRGHYDVVIVSRPDNMALVRNTLRDRPHLLDGTRVVYDAEALFSARDIAKARVQGRPLSTAEIEAHTSAEVSLAQGVDAVVCVNEAEAKIFRARQSSPVHVLSYPAEPTAGGPGFAERSGFLFVGRLLEHDAPNWQGLAWFVRECWPLVRAALPDATLSVLGGLHPEHAELEGPGIHLLGSAAKLEPFYASARVFLAPIRFAAGIPIKILEATAAGLPTAGTRLMATQLAWTPGVEIAAEDGAGALATASTELHEEAAAWEAMRTASQRRLKHEHGAAVFRGRLRLLLDGCSPLNEGTL